ncbi:MAG: hypothetical protein KF723_14460 [Rhizobiaceae bacterium]|nr:hypothetical protein [Rhizobiaceae bacterium]
MHAGEAGRPDQGSAYRDELTGLRSQIAERDRTVASLTTIVDRQIGLIERYDAVIRNGKAGTPDGAVSDALERALALLDQAVAGVERRARDVEALERQLDRTLELLDQSLRTQEGMVSRGLGGGHSPMADSVELTLAKYDQMLERSLSALETAYQATQTSQKEVGDRDRLLKRTMDLLENTVEAGGAGSRRSGLFGRLFA